jgi:hypothetical protein
VSASPRSRDAVSWLKHDPSSPAAGTVRWAYGYGRSQDRPLPAQLVYWDLNLDEQGREAFDGIIANVAGGMRGEFNQRFGQNSKDPPPDDGPRLPLHRRGHHRPGHEHPDALQPASGCAAAAG